MSLEGFVQLIEELRQRVAKHRDALRQSEMLTRYVLVDPLLRGLGWDTENAEHMHPEYKSGSKWADYALLRNGKPIVMVEAKKLGTPIQEGLEQGIHYCLTEGTPYFAVTDGQRWEIYETHKMVPLAEKRVMFFDLLTLDPAETTLKALVLWRPNLLTGKPIPATTPIVTQPSQEASRAASVSLGLPTTVSGGGPPSSAAKPSGWVSLAQLQVKKYDSPPSRLRLPDGSEVAIRYWVDIPVETAKWLEQHGRLTPQHSPIRYGERYLLNTSPVHPDGKPFTLSRALGRFHLETNYSASDHIRNIRLILDKVALDSNQFSVRF
jgi:hypothetical protein